jgi:DNA polymerase III delta prime subunit
MTKLINFLQKDKLNMFPFYIITGNFSENQKIILEFLKKEFNFQSKKNTEFYLFKELSLSIDNSRKIKKINSILKEDGEKLRIIFIETKKIEENSQNALLKTFEEPQKNTIFFLFLPNKELILDTLISRARVIEGEQNISSQRAKEFLSGDYIFREKMIEKIINKYSNEKENKSQKIKNNFLELFREIEVLFLDNLHSKEKTKDELLTISKFYKEFLNLKKQAHQNGSGIKNIFIYLAIFLPKI